MSNEKSNIQKYKNLLNVYHKSNESVMLVGLHGVGKSAVIEQWCKENNIYLETILVSIKEIGDLIGSQQIINNCLHYAYPPYIQNIEKAHKEGKHVAIFFDELNRGYKDVRDASLQITLKGIIGDYQLPILNGIKTFVISAINPSEYYDVADFDPALEDRYSVINFELTLDDFIEYSNSIDTPKVIIEFLKTYPKYLHTFLENRNKKNKLEKYKVLNDRCATNRSWTQLGECLKNKTTDTDIFELIIGKVGLEVGEQFYSFYTNFENTISVDTIYNLIDENSTLVDNTFNLQNYFNDNNSLETSQALTLLENLFKNVDLNANLQTKNNMAFIAFISMINLEIATNFLTTLKIKSHEEYLKLAQIDKSIFQKISKTIHTVNKD